MVDKSLIDLSWDDFDEQRDPRPAGNQFDAVVDRAISRRGFLGGALAFGSGAAVFGTGLLSSTTASRAAVTGPPSLLGPSPDMSMTRRNPVKLFAAK